MPDRAAVFRKDQVVEIINMVVNKVAHPRNGMDDKVLQELYGLKNSIDELRNELSVVHPDRIAESIPGATDQLDAIVSATETATFTIIHACENIQNILKGNSFEHGEHIEEEITRIIEACAFQDITGQRVAKIVKSLRLIEEHASGLEGVFNTYFSDLKKSDPSLDKKEKQESKESLLNGPQLPGQGITQDDIDAILNSF